MIVSTMALMGLFVGVANASEFKWSAEQRFNYTLAPADLVVDAEGTTMGQRSVLDQRTRIGLNYEDGNGFRAVTEWDLFEGQVLGDAWNLGSIDDRRRDQLIADLDRHTARALNVGFRAPRFDISMGLTTSHWGLGMVANDGAHDGVFGRSDLGDRVVRTRLTTATPTASGGLIYYAIAFDGVVEDDMMSALDGQRAHQKILSVLHKGASGSELGTYLVHRTQREVDMYRETNAGMADLYFKQPISAGGWGLELSAEMAMIYGKTSRAVTYQSQESLSVIAGGAVAQVSIEPPSGGLELLLRGGYASGDPNSDDAYSNDFSFDRNFDVGMVMFDEVGGAIEAATYNLIMDPAHSGQAPDGVEATVTEGSFRRAIFFQPVLTYSLADTLDFRLGFVSAWATAPISQVFYTVRAGGSARNHLDQPTEGYAMGNEVDWSVSWSPSIKEGTPIFLGLQGGHARMSDNLSTEGDARVDLLLSTLKLVW